MAIPIFGSGEMFINTKGSIVYTITFDYLDPEKEYYKIIKSSLKQKEENRIKKEMQKQLINEKTILNEKYEFPSVKHAEIGVKNLTKISFARFYIEIPWTPKVGKNIYENIHDETVSEYSYTVSLILPGCGRFIDVEMPGNIAIKDNYAFIYVPKGTKINGYESFIFEISNECI